MTGTVQSTPVGACRGKGLVVPALLGASGSILLALASDLPGSPYGPHAAGLWPLEFSGAAPGWEGPLVPGWANVADQAGARPIAHLLVTVAVVIGIALLSLAWILVWRHARRGLSLDRRRLWWVATAWVAPLLAAAPFATQDIWTYGLEGHLVLDGFGGYRSSSVLPHSIWTSGFVGSSIRPSPYGPGELDLSAFFVKLSGGHPWLAAECWRLTAIIGLVLCAWGVHRIVSLRGGNATAAVIGGVANPAMLLVLVGGIHNDALMLGLIVAGIAVAMSGSPSWGILLCASGVAVKSSALLAVGAMAWWAWGDSWRQRARGILSAAVAVVGVLVVSGVPVGGGFGWLSALSANNAIQGTWSLGARFFSPSRSWSASTIEITGFLLALFFVLRTRRSRPWIVDLGWGFAALAVTSMRPEPWYLAWALVLLSCGGLVRKSEQFAAVVLGAMMVGSVLPAGPLWWFAGIVLLLWLGIVAVRSRMEIDGPSSRHSSSEDTRTSTSVPVS